ncbi:MAG: hypothetical protein AB1552_06820 [Nitrospirota bacterium]
MKTISLLLMIVLLIAASMTTTAFAGGPWKGKIIDIETKEPIEGAVVLAIWQRAYRTPAGDNTYFYKAKEVLTDKEGRYEIPAYTPINLLPIISYIREPEFFIFKPGYLSLSGRHLEENVIDNSSEFKRNKKIYRLAPGIIELPKLKTREERKINLYSVPPSIPDDKMPKFIQLMNEEEIDIGLQPTHIRRRAR